MKRFFFTYLIISITISVTAQGIQGGLIGGFNMSQVDGDEVYGFHKYGWNVGACGIVPVKKKFSFILETLYNQKGSYQRPRTTDSLNGSYKLKLYYLDVPILFSYINDDVIAVGTGFSWGRLVEFAEWEHGHKVNWTTKRGPYFRNDTEWLFDVQLRIYKNWRFNARYAYSLFNLRTRTFKTGEVRHQYNNVITLRALYIFGDKH